MTATGLHDVKIQSKVQLWSCMAPLETRYIVSRTTVESSDDTEPCQELPHYPPLKQGTQVARQAPSTTQHRRLNTDTIVKHKDTAPWRTTSQMYTKDFNIISILHLSGTCKGNGDDMITNIITSVDLAMNGQ